MLVAVAVAVADDFDARGIGVHPRGKAGGPDEAVVAFRAGGGLGVVGPRATALIDVGGRDAIGLAGLVGERAAAVAGVQVELAVGPGDDRVQRVVMVLATEAAQDHFAFIDRGVELAVAIHIGELDEVGGVGNNDDVVEDRDAQRRGPTRVLHEGVDGVGLAGPLAVAEHHDAVAFRATLTAFVVDAVVDAFGDPHAPLGIDVQVRGIGQHGRARPERDFQALGDLEKVERNGTPFGGRVRLGGGRKGNGGHQEEGETGHAPITRASAESSSLSYQSAAEYPPRDRVAARSIRAGLQGPSSAPLTSSARDASADRRG